MAETEKIGRCEVCKKDIYRGGRSGVYIGHHPKCKNAKTKNLEA